MLSRLIFSNFPFEIFLILLPLTITSPVKLLSMQPITLSRVVFPEPEGPIIAIISPSLTVKSIPAKASFL